MKKNPTNIREYLGLQIDLVCKIKYYNDEEKVLKPLPKRFLIEVIILNALGIDINSSEAANILYKKIGWKSIDDVYVYRSKLKNKWLFIDVTTGNLRVPSIFNKTIEELLKPKLYNFEIGIDPNKIKSIEDSIFDIKKSLGLIIPDSIVNTNINTDTDTDTSG